MLPLFLDETVIKYLITFFTIEVKIYDNNLQHANDIIKMNYFFIDIYIAFIIQNKNNCSQNSRFLIRSPSSLVLACFKKNGSSSVQFHLRYVIDSLYIITK